MTKVVDGASHATARVKFTRQIANTDRARLRIMCGIGKETSIDTLCTRKTATRKGAGLKLRISAASSAVSESVDPQVGLTPVTTDPIDCLDSAILVEATTDSSTYKVGKEPVLTLTIENTGSVACLWDVGPKANELEVKSGGYHAWSSDDCSPSKKTKVVTLEPDDRVASTIEWNGQLSEPGCPESDQAAKVGRYEVIGRNLDVFSEATPFALTKKN